LAVVVAALALGGCASSSLQNDNAYETVGEAPNREPAKAERLTRRAKTKIKKGEYGKAEDLLKQALEADVTYGPAHNSLGKAYYHQNKLYKAAWEFQYAIKLMPDQAIPKNNLGLALEAAGKLKQAVDHYEKARALAPDNPKLLGNLTRAKLKLGQQDKQVQKLLQELISKDNRPRWVKWAREQLMLLERSDPSVEKPAASKPQTR
jgi:Tfp pilus assembly protein PilF